MRTDLVYRDWEAHGFECRIVRSPASGFNGYVKLSDGHPWVDDDYDDIPADVHGGLTYGPDEEGWIGFDTAHSGDYWENVPDAPKIGPLDPELDGIVQMGNLARSMLGIQGGGNWTIERLTAEVESLAQQVKDAAA